MLARQHLEQSVRTALGRSRAVVLAGLRQSGKSTLARKFLPRESPRYFDLENPRLEQRLEQPIDTLSRLDALYVVYPGEPRFALADGVEAVPIWAMLPARAATG